MRTGTRRRRFLLVAGAMLVAPFGANSQRAAKPYRIGMLFPVRAGDATGNVEAFQQGLRELGYRERRDYSLEPRYSDGNDQRFGALAAELATLKVDVIVSWGTVATRAAKQASRTLPIVTAAVVDPVGSGLIMSLAQPGGNVTGVTSGGAELSRKSLQLIKELVPAMTRIAVIWNPANPIQPVTFRETQIAAEALRIRVYSLGVTEPAEMESAFANIRQERPDALIVLQDPALQAHRPSIIDFATRMRLPAVYERRAWVDAGGLISYGVSITSNFRRAAAFVDKILKGAKPSDLPVEDPTKFELVINLKAAKSIGITIPQSVLVRADSVLQ